MAKKTDSEKPKKRKAGKLIQWWKYKKQVKQAILSGKSVKNTCDILGINEATWYRWKKNRRAFREFIESIKRQQIDARIDIASAALLQGMQGKTIQLKKQVVTGKGEIIEVVYDKYLPANANLILETLKTNGKFIDNDIEDLDTYIENLARAAELEEEADCQDG